MGSRVYLRDPLDCRAEIQLLFFQLTKPHVLTTYTMSEEDYQHDLDLSEEDERDFQAELEEGYAQIEDQFAVDTQSGFENVLVLDNVPIVDEGKRGKLVTRLRSDFNKAGAPIDEENIQMPWDDEAGTNKG